MCTFVMEEGDCGFTPKNDVIVMRVFSSRPHLFSVMRWPDAYSHHRDPRCSYLYSASTHGINSLAYSLPGMPANPYPFNTNTKKIVIQTNCNTEHCSIKNWNRRNFNTKYCITKKL